MFMLNALSNPTPSGTTSLVAGGGQFPLNSVVSGSGGTGKLKVDCVSDPLALKFDNCPLAISPAHNRFQLTFFLADASC
jgi:hypothetical protein